MPKINLVMISIDGSVLKKWSSLQKRLSQYSTLVDSLDVIVYSPKGYKAFTIGKNIRVFPTNSVSKLHFIRDAYRIWKKVCNVLDAKNTVISTQDPFETWMVWYLLKKKYWCALNIQIHTDPFSLYFRKESLLNRLRYYFFRYFLIKKVDSIRTVSKLVKDFIVRTFHVKEVVNIPIFVDMSPKTINKKSKKNTFTILSLSRLEKVKNIFWLMRVFVQWIKTYPDRRLTIVWTWSEEKNIQKFITQHKLKDKVLVKPRTDDVDKEYQQSDLFVLNSFYEWRGMTAIEAASNWVPVIMTKTWCAGDFLLDKVNGLLININDEKHLYAALVKMYKNPKFRQTCIKNGYLQLKKLPTFQDTLLQYKNSREMALYHNKASWKN